jgi:glycosyltransferase involved in cell wall biosynthesis
VRAVESQLGLESRVIRTGWLPPALISAALAAADVAALPYADGASLRRSALITCLAHGLPVVTTTPQQSADLPAGYRVPPFDDPASLRIDERVVALAPPRDYMALADTLADLARSPGRREALGEAARRFAAPLTWPNVSAAHLGFYSDVSGTAA